MSKYVKPALIAAAVVFTGGALTVGFGTTLTSLTVATGGLSATGMALYTFVTTVVGGVLGGLTSRGIDAVRGNFGTKFATRGSAMPRQIVYGKCRVGGTVLYLQTGGTDNHMLHMIVGVAGHEIDAVETVRVNDIDLTSITETVASETVNTVTNADFTNTDNENAFASGRLIRFQTNLGADDQTASNFAITSVASFGGGITTDHRFRGIAYVYLQFIYDADKFGGGLPSVSFIVRGKKCFDPRDSSTAFTSNPALIIRDFLTDTRYGLKCKSAEINDSTSAGGFASAANICDQTVTLEDGSSTEKRYTANGFTNMSARGDGIIEGLLSSCVGKLTYTNGKFNVFAGASQSASLTITDDDILEGIQINTSPKSGELYNTVKTAYVNASEDYQASDAPLFQSSTFLNADTPSGESTANYVKTMELQLPFTTSTETAQRIGRILLNQNRQRKTLTVLTTLKFMQLQPSDFVNLTNTRLNFSSKLFEVLSTNLEVVGSENPFLAVRLTLKETATTIYDFGSSDYETPQGEGSVVVTDDNSISAPTNLTATNITNNSFTVNQVNVRLSWTNSGFQQTLTGIQVDYKKSSDSSYDEYAIIPPAVTQVTIRGLEANTSYDFRIRNIAFSGAVSSFVSVTNHSTGGTARTSGQIVTSEGTAANITNQGNLATLDTVDTAQLVDDAVTTAKIINDAVTNALIATDAVNQDSIAANSVTASEINVATLSSISANVGTLNAGTIDAGSMTINNLNAGSITAGSLNAQRLTLNGSTLTGDANGLKVTTSGITSNEIGTRATGSFAVNGASGTSSFGDGRSGDNFSDLVTTTFTSAEAGDYLIVANCMVGGTFNSLTQLESRIISGSTTIAEYQSPVGGSAIQPVILAGKITLLANTSFTVKMQGQVIADNTTPSIGGFSTRISALKLNKQ